LFSAIIHCNSLSIHIFQPEFVCISSGISVVASIINPNPIQSAFVQRWRSTKTIIRACICSSLPRCQTSHSFCSHKSSS
jgi:hypothetical protein